MWCDAHLELFPAVIYAGMSYDFSIELYMKLAALVVNFNAECWVIHSLFTTCSLQEHDIILTAWR